jgi:hypothetical protein
MALNGTSSPRALRARMSCGWKSPGKALDAATALQMRAWRGWGGGFGGGFEGGWGFREES